jgi:hypothetical protein
MEREKKFIFIKCLMIGLIYSLLGFSLRSFLDLSLDVPLLQHWYFAQCKVWALSNCVLCGLQSPTSLKAKFFFCQEKKISKKEEEVNNVKKSLGFIN